MKSCALRDRDQPCVDLIRTSPEQHPNVYTFCYGISNKLTRGFGLDLQQMERPVAGIEKVGPSLGC
jgi:hypothetical protein